MGGMHAHLPASVICATNGVAGKAAASPEPASTSMSGQGMARRAGTHGRRACQVCSRALGQRSGDRKRRVHQPLEASTTSARQGKSAHPKRAKGGKGEKVENGGNGESGKV